MNNLLAFGELTDNQQARPLLWGELPIIINHVNINPANGLGGGGLILYDF